MLRYLGSAAEESEERRAWVIVITIRGGVSKWVRRLMHGALPHCPTLTTLSWRHTHGTPSGIAGQQ
jgi:hypothetical protein